MYKNRSVSSCGVLKSINNINHKLNTMKPAKVSKTPVKCRALRNLEAELGVERYKNQILTEEIFNFKAEITRSLKYDKQLKALQDDFEHLSFSVRRSKMIQERQKEEIEYLKQVLISVKKCK